MLTVGADAAHDRGQMEDHVRPGLFQKSVDGFFVAQIIVFASGYKNLHTTPLLELSAEMRT
jgi:hypothetical protein